MKIRPAPVAFLDANVLYSALLRDIFMHLALHDVCRIHWSARVEEEWIGALAERRPDLKRETIERVRDLMNLCFRDARVGGYENRESALRLPDPNDVHVLAAAIHCGAGAIVTLNLRDFPKQALAPFGVRAVHPDQFFQEAFETDPDAILAAVKELRAAYRNPARTATELLATMKKQGLTRSADVLNPLVRRF